MNWLQLVRSVAILKVDRNPSPSLRRIEGLSLINTIMSLEQKDSRSPNPVTSCPFLTLTQRKAAGALLLRVGRNEVEWSNIPNHKSVLETFLHVKVALGAWKLPKFVCCCRGCAMTLALLQMTKMKWPSSISFFASFSISQLHYWGSQRWGFRL